MKNLKKSKRRKTKRRKTYKGGAAAEDTYGLITKIVNTINEKLNLNLTDYEKKLYYYILFEKNISKLQRHIIYSIERNYRRLQNGEIDITYFKHYLVTMGLPVDKSELERCVGPSCTISNGVVGVQTANNLDDIYDR